MRQFVFAVAVLGGLGCSGVRTGLQGSPDAGAPDSGISLGVYPDGGSRSNAPPPGTGSVPDGGTDPCSSPAHPPTGDRFFTLQSAGGLRWFYLHVPSSYSPQKTELVLNFHGFTSDPLQEALLSQMNGAADARGVIVAYPAGLDASWNAGLCCGDSAWVSQVDDVQFVRDTLDAISSAYCIDPKRVFATGMSNGGFLSHRLGCELSDRIAAIAPVAGVMGVASCNPGRHVPVMHFHGTLDPLVPYYGGGSQGFPSVAESTAGWIARNGCGPATTSIYSQGDASCTRWDCPTDGETVLCTIDGGGHTWPGGTPVPSLGKTSTDLDATSMMLDFFDRNPMR
jgi:polyhydroxybutyrate depolymerase